MHAKGCAVLVAGLLLLAGCGSGHPKAQQEVIFRGKWARLHTVGMVVLPLNARPAVRKVLASSNCAVVTRNSHTGKFAAKPCKHR